MKKFKVVPGALLMMVVATGVGAAPAHAVESNCFSREVCLYQQSYYSGCFYRWTGNDRDYRDNKPSKQTSLNVCNAATMNDYATSIDNDGANCGTTHFVDLGEQGRGFYLPRGDYIGALSQTYDDELTSHRWC